MELIDHSELFLVGTDPRYKKNVMKVKDRLRKEYQLDSEIFNKNGKILWPVTYGAFRALCDTLQEVKLPFRQYNEGQMAQESVVSLYFYPASSKHDDVVKQWIEMNAIILNEKFKHSPNLYSVFLWARSLEPSTSAPDNSLSIRFNLLISVIEIISSALNLMEKTARVR